MAQSPSAPESLYEAATIAGKLGNARDQEAAWRKLRGDFPDHPLASRAGLELASASYKRKEWKDAVTHAQVATKSDDEAVRAEAWLLTGEAELKLKRFQNAEKAFDAATAVTGADTGLRYRAMAGLGLAHEEQREWKAALAAYESVAGKSPDATLRDWAKERAQAVKRHITTTPPPGGGKKPRSGS
jgi:tetratricopeptide (TPR) repeat protein